MTIVCVTYKVPCPQRMKGVSKTKKTGLDWEINRASFDLPVVFCGLDWEINRVSFDLPVVFWKGSHNCCDFNLLLIALTSSRPALHQLNVSHRMGQGLVLA